MRQKQNENWKPNLFLVGAAKSGTTSLAELLGTEDEVQLPIKKEPFYFVEGYGLQKIEEYQSLYQPGSLWRLDASTGYLFDPQCPEKIKEFNPEAKILIVLRNPIDFVVSYWEYMKAHGNEKCNFYDAISDLERERRHTEEFKESCEQWPASYWYIERAFFFEQVARYLKVFGSQKVKIVLFEKLVRDKTVIEEIYNFLGLDHQEGVELPRINQSGKPRPIIKFLRFSKRASLIKRIVYGILPTALRLKIRKIVVMKAVTDKRYEKFMLSDEYRARLTNVFFDDVAQLRQLLPHLDFNCWTDFSS